MERYLSLYKSVQEKINALSYAMYIISWDSETEAPVGCFEERANQIGVLVSMMMEYTHNAEYIDAVKALYENKSNFEIDFQKEIEKVYTALMKEIKIPPHELVDYQVLLAKANNIWCDAKTTDNYDLFKSTLKEIINWNKKYTVYLETENLKGYDVLLDEYEKGFTQKEYDLFFNALKKDLVPFVKNVLKKGNKEFKFLDKTYDCNIQKEFCNYLMDVMCFDKTFGLTKESEHPFTSGHGTTDVRVTCHYYDDQLTSAIFSMIHELGHGTYERQCDPIYNNTALSGGTTMAMHESQSRFYENIVGRAYPFWQKHFPKLQSLFNDQLTDVTVEEFYEAVNKVENSLIRTEADELTYPLHIMVRYDIEKMLFNEGVDFETLPSLWNKLYKDYLDIDVPSDKMGILQDIHWAGGMFGYFPTYALGSAYAAQIYNQMKQELDIESILKEDNLEKINHWLKEKVHKFAGSKTPKEILVDITGEEFNPKYYIEYLKDKYSKIYKIDK